MVKIKIAIFLIVLIILSLVLTLNANETSNVLEIGNHYFTAEWCVACKKQTPIIKKLQKEGYVIKIHKDIPKDIKTLPTIIIVNGEIILKLKGIQSYQKLQRLMVK